MDIDRNGLNTSSSSSSDEENEELLQVINVINNYNTHNHNQQRNKIPRVQNYIRDVVNNFNNEQFRKTFRLVLLIKIKINVIIFKIFDIYYGFNIIRY